MKNFIKTAEKLNLNSILKDIAGRCVSESANTRLQQPVPHQNQDELQQIFKQISEMRDIYSEEGGFPIWEFYDVRRLLSMIEPHNSYLESKDFLKLKNILELIVEMNAFYSKRKEKYPTLGLTLNQLLPQEKLLNHIHFTFEPSGRIFDNASNDLKQIRKEIEKVDNQIQTTLNRILKKQKDHIQEEYITLRDGRLVVPVREYSVTKVPGIVHGQSGSGATYFVEPLSVVDHNNNLLKLYSQEKKEIIRILRRLSKIVRDEQEVLLSNFYTLIIVDTIQARARYANENACNAPLISSEFQWKLINAKHPQLLKTHPKETVPLSCTFGKDIRQMIISGPNAGGKTVALKTIGIMQMLFQCGFHIPLDEGSSLPLCEDVFAVIGDDQSLENDLSTFSSHVSSLNHIVESNPERSLILIDEIGNGTEPDGGAALAVAFLEYTNQEELAVIATTHQNQLKVYAGNTDGVKNAAMQFDMENLTPLFTLEAGIPGSSYTFEICKRLGLNSQILSKAKKLAGDKSFELDQLLVDVNNVSQNYRQLATKLNVKESKLEGLIRLNERRNTELKKISKDFDKTAKQEAAKIIKNANKEIEKAIREIKESQADKNIIKAVRKNIEDKKKELSAEEQQKQVASLDIQTVKKGMRVKSKDYQLIGNISKIFKGKNEVEIEKEGLKITVPINSLEVLDEDGQTVDIRAEHTVSAPSFNIHNELDLRGLMVEEAILELKIYLDKVLLSNWEEVRIVHGKGTGVLRKAIQEFLPTYKGIKTFRSGKWGEGDSGVTVIEV
jgi:DNA mismatch repair protein MutS2